MLIKNNYKIKNIIIIIFFIFNIIIMLKPAEKNKIIIKRELLKKLKLSNKINFYDIKKKTEEIKSLILNEKSNRNDSNNINKLKFNNSYRPFLSFYNNVNNKRKNKIYNNNSNNTTSTIYNHNIQLTSSLNNNIEKFLNSKIDFLYLNDKDYYKKINEKRKLNLNFLKEENNQINNKTFNNNLFPFLKLKKKKKIFLLSNNTSKTNLSNSNNSNNNKYFENKILKRKNILSGDFSEENHKRNKIKIPFQNTLLKYKLEVYFNNIKTRTKFNSNENILF